MPDLLCPFSATLVKKDFGCKHAKEIIRRGGAEIACEKSDVHTVCSTLHNTIKTSALQAMNVEDDLQTLPHSVLVKIQYGGLLGLQKVTMGESQKGNRIDDISLLVSIVMEKFQSMEDIPFDSINKTIIDYKTQRRRKK